MFVACIAQVTTDHRDEDLGLGDGHLVLVAQSGLQAARVEDERGRALEIGELRQRIHRVIDHRDLAQIDGLEPAARLSGAARAHLRSAGGDAVAD